MTSNIAKTYKHHYSYINTHQFTVQFKVKKCARSKFKYSNYINTIAYNTNDKIIFNTVYAAKSLTRRQ